MSELIVLPDFNKEPIRALSWKAPYAQLMLRDKIETRTWETKYRGWVLICCSKSPYSLSDLADIAGPDQLERILRGHPSILNFQPQLGQAIAVGKLVDCRPMVFLDQDSCFVKHKEPWVMPKMKVNGTIKNNMKQLWCHVYENVTPIELFPFTGGQGWKKLTAAQIKKIKLTSKDIDFLIKQAGLTNKNIQL